MCSAQEKRRLSPYDEEQTAHHRLKLLGGGGGWGRANPHTRVEVAPTGNIIELMHESNTLRSHLYLRLWHKANLIWVPPQLCRISPVVCLWCMVIDGFRLCTRLSVVLILRCLLAIETVTQQAVCRLANRARNKLLLV